MVVACVAVTPSFPKTVLSREVRSALTTLRKLIEVRTVGNVIGLLSLGRRSPRRGDRRFVFNPGAFRGQPTAISALRGGPRSFFVCMEERTLWARVLHRNVVEMMKSDDGCQLVAAENVSLPRVPARSKRKRETEKAT